jgi:hypothetical protein
MWFLSEIWSMLHLSQNCVNQWFPRWLGEKELMETRLYAFPILYRDQIDQLMDRHSDPKQIKMICFLLRSCRQISYDLRYVMEFVCSVMRSAEYSYFNVWQYSGLSIILKSHPCVALHVRTRLCRLHICKGDVSLSLMMRARTCRKECRIPDAYSKLLIRMSDRKCECKVTHVNYIAEIIKANSSARLLEGIFVLPCAS